ncbi:hypothetical protein AAWM_08236 [Aspergillus awamori]|uniref:Uncharacterized protein n=1 Tax=Aspergillus awamori TaxID=105351 RepID=A0A401L1F1_ASPAW|nr:hypothetical protein AAWM_08236 [Aspergillus awamori]GKZ55817.1 hypothetical protein AnigIFM49718_000983 [Aspergillus niger]GLA20866.1 hypothetical protein AnigIFM62618_009840 [Aspergillus niger]
MGLIKTGIQLAGAYGLLRAGSKAANEFQEKKQSKQDNQGHQCSCCHHHQQPPYPQQFPPVQQVPHHEYGYNNPQMYPPQGAPQYASNGPHYANPGPQYQHPPVHYEGHAPVQRSEQQQPQGHQWPEWR